MFKRAALTVALGSAFVGLSGQTALATLVTLNDRNTEAKSDFNSVGDFFDFVVDGTDHLDREWFWIRVNDDDRETKVTALDGKDFIHYDGNFDPGEDHIFARWFDPMDRFEITVEEVLTGGTVGSAVSNFSQTVRVTNLSDAPLRLNLFQLANFDLLGTPGGDTVEVISDNVIMQTELNSFMRETFTNHSPTSTQVAEADTLYNALTDAGVTNLDGSTGPFAGSDVEYAVQWTTTIPVGGAFFVNKDFFISAPDSIVPEPASAVMLGLAGLALLGVRRRQA